MAVFLGCTSTGRVGLCFLWFYVQELPKAQPAVVLVLKRLRRRGNGLKSHPTDLEKPGIEPATPGLQEIGLSPTPRRLLSVFLCHEQTLAGYFEFLNILFKSIVFKHQLRNKPHLHIKGANKLKVRFILLV